VTEDRKTAALKRLALSPEQREALAKLRPAVPPALAKTFKQLDPRVREARAELARLRREIALRQQAASEIEAWLEREMSAVEPKPAPKPEPEPEPRPEPKPQRMANPAKAQIERVLLAKKVSDEAAVKMGPAAVHRLLESWADDETEHPGEHVVAASERSVGRHLKTLREKLKGR
jgi:hypothetical protein